MARKSGLAPQAPAPLCLGRGLWLEGTPGAGQLGHQEGRNLRAVGKRLAIEATEPWHDIERLTFPDIEFGVLGPQMPGDHLRMDIFVVAKLV